MLNGVGAVVMGLVAGPAALIAAYSVTYLLHGSAARCMRPCCTGRRSAGNRATVLSMNSMVAFAAFGVFAPLLGLLAEQTSTQVAMVAAGAVSIVGAWFYLPARRAEKARSREGAAEPASV